MRIPIPMKFFIPLLLLSSAGGTDVLAASALPDPAGQAQLEPPSSKASKGQITRHTGDGVRHQLLVLPYYGIFDWLEFDLNSDRSIVLRGQVTGPALKADAEAALRKIESITRVENQIEVLPVSPVDNKIRIAVYRSIFKYEGPMFRYSNQSSRPIHIIVNNGRVALKGVVDSEADSQLAYTAAREVSGVFEVRNELRVTHRS